MAQQKPKGASLAVFSLCFWFIACPSSSPPKIENLDILNQADSRTEVDQITDGFVSDQQVDGDIATGDSAQVACFEDSQCSGGLFCDPLSHTCVECYKDEQCGEGKICLANHCVGGPCEETGGCEPPLVCDPNTNTCVECIDESHCPKGYACVNNRCTPKPCEEGGECPEGLVCDEETSSCVQCLTYEQCLPEEFCDPISKTCMPDICIAGTLDCVGNTVVACRADGSGFDTLVECPQDRVCKNGVCEKPCTPSCVGKECGDDGCGGSCGTCPPGKTCKDYRCIGCTPSCVGKECGDDGCGGSCGTCPPGKKCENYRCVGCIPSCAGKECGDDGCGGSCGQCDPSKQCVNGKCVCIPSCTGKQCGDDGCGGSCGTCPVGYYCMDGICQQECKPNCVGKHCGPDGCGGSCGQCPQDYYCTLNQVCEPICIPSCLGKQCGPDGCGGQCGGCPSDKYCSEDGQCLDFWSCLDILICSWGCADDDYLCEQQCFLNGSPAAQKQWLDMWTCVMEACVGQPQDSPCWAQALYGTCKELYYACLNCTPNCIGKQCGPDGCGGSCGTCPNNAPCDDYGQCPCIPSCQGKECGPNGCGGLCGICPDNLVCSAAGKCICLRQCQGKECGPDGCGGSCGKCPEGYNCVYGKCEPVCVPNCANKQCGPDGCGGSCGECPAGYECSFDGMCVPISGLSCWEGIDCILQCNAQFEVCFDSCRVRVNTSERQIFTQVVRCASRGCVTASGHLDRNCFLMRLNTDCVQQYSQCIGGGCVPQCFGKECGPDGCGGECGVCPPGFVCSPEGLCIASNQKTCGDAVQCLFSCGYDFGCIQGCMSGLSPQSMQKLMDLAYCVISACGFNLTPECIAQAITSSCRSQYVACMNDTGS